MWSIVDQNVMRRMTVCVCVCSVINVHWKLTLTVYLKIIRLRTIWLHKCRNWQACWTGCVPLHYRRKASISLSLTHCSWVFLLYLCHIFQCSFIWKELFWKSHCTIYLFVCCVDLWVPVLVVCDISHVTYIYCICSRNFHPRIFCAP